MATKKGVRLHHDQLSPATMRLSCDSCLVETKPHISAAWLLLSDSIWTLNRRCCGPRSPCTPQSRSALIRLCYYSFEFIIIVFANLFWAALLSFALIGHWEFSDTVRNIHLGGKKGKQCWKICRKTLKSERELGLVPSTMMWGLRKNHADFILRPCQSQTGLIPAGGRFVRSRCCTSLCLRLLPVAQWPLWPRSGIGVNRRQMDEQLSMFSSRPRSCCCSFLDNFDLKCDISSLNLRFCFFGQTQARSTHSRVSPVRKKKPVKHLFWKQKWVFKFIYIPTHSVITTQLRNPFTVTVKQEENMFIELSSWWVRSSGADIIFITPAPPIQFQASLFFP